MSRDSTMAEAWGALSRANSLLYNNGTPTMQLQQAALAAARRAVSLEPNGSAGHRAMGWYHRVVTRSPVTSLREYELALSVAPASVAILTDMANTKDDLGRFDESVRGPRDARFDSIRRNFTSLRWPARTLLRLRRTAEARAAAERAVALAPTSLIALSARHLAEAASGNLAGARQAVAAAVRDIPAPRVLAYVGNYWDMSWTLDSASAYQLLRARP